MIVAHNISAINTYNQLKTSSSTLNSSIEKLSSGFRINRAADDAAGLSISEKMRSQIRGLNQASENASQGISIIQTAEGALNESHAILQRIRELAIQSANGTNAEEDRAALQHEVSELITEINRIGNTTEFNGRKILNGDYGIKVTGMDYSDRIEGLEFINTIQLSKNRLAKGYFDLSSLNELALWSAFSPNKGENLITIYKGSNNNVLFDLKAMNGNLTKQYLLNTPIEYDSFESNTKHLYYDEEHDKLKRLDYPVYTDINDYLNDTTYNYTKLPFQETDNEYIFDKWGMELALDKKMVDNALQNKNSLTIDLYDIGQINDFTSFKVDNVRYYQAQYVTKEDFKNWLELGTDNYFYKLLYYGDRLVTLSQNTSNDGLPVFKIDNTELEVKIQETLDIAAVSDPPLTSIPSENPSTTVNGDSIDLRYKILDYLDDNTLYYFEGRLYQDEYYANHSYDGALLGNIYPLNNKMYRLDCSNINYDFGLIKETTEDNDGLVFHVGANSNQTISCTFNDMRARNLGLTGWGEGYSKTLDVTDGSSSVCREFGVNISTRSSAEKVIGIVDNAISIVSKERSRYGAVQNRLEYTINNLNATSENMSNAESIIRDADMAEEMMNETKSNILQQASQAMLVQAMHRPEQVLNLLKQ